MSTQPTTDVLDRLAGIAAGSPLDALRHERPETRGNVQASYQALFDASDETGASLPERFAVASFVALLHGDGASAQHYLERLEQTEGDRLSTLVREQAKRAAASGPYGAYPPGPLSSEDSEGPILAIEIADRARLGERLAAALEHAHRLVFHPRDAKATDFSALQAAGWSTAAIVTLSQIVAFLSFQIRAAHGLRVLGA